MLLSCFFSRILRSLKDVSVNGTLDKHYSPINTFACEDVKTSDSLRRDSTTATTPSAKPFAIYNGGYECARKRGICLRIANGGAGQTGLIRAWADTFIQYMVAKGAEPFEVSLRHSTLPRHYERSQVAWFLGDTTESLAILSAGVVDVALTYNPAAEKLLLDSGDAVESLYAYRVSDLAV